MTDSLHPRNAPSEIAGHLRRWIIVGGLLLGGWGLFENLLMLAAWGPAVYARHFRFAALVPLHRLAVAMWLAAPPLLLVGCWAFHRHRPWARPALLAYVAVSVGGLLGVQVAHFADVLSGARGDLAFRQVLSGAVGQLDLLVFGSVFPAFVFLSLRRPEVIDTFAADRGGFPPLTAREPGE